jgi:hypothetical protein
MSPFDIGSITDQNLDALVIAQTRESSVIEFKLELPGKTDSDRREFLADASSFANARGGIILYGVATERDDRGQDTGIAKEVTGLTGINADSDIQRLEAMLRDGIDPPLTAQVRFQVVERNGKPPVIALGLFQSFAGPHRVVFSGSNRFWRRGQAGKYEPDVGELKDMFLGTAGWLDRAEKRRDDRRQKVQRVYGKDAQSRTLIHIFPLADLDYQIDILAHESTLCQACPPLESHGWSWRFNSDGYMVYHQPTEGFLSYTLWFRTGGVEGFASDYVKDWSLGDVTVKTLFLREMKQSMLEWSAKAIPVLQNSLLVPPPYAILVTIEGTAGARIPTGSGTRFSNYTIDEDLLALPPVLIDPARQTVEVALKPVFDTIAQSAGLASAK